ncbi:MAG: hypothetical protein HOV66_23090 [Streptomycetaceae bacterium]|nr:hypothetical protein [Streptomycetaceae bacterium]
MTMTDTEYATAGPDRATSRTWTTFTKVSTRGAFWVLRISSQSAMALPRAALDEAQTAVFIAAMKEKGLLDPAYPSAR